MNKRQITTWVLLLCAAPGLAAGAPGDPPPDPTTFEGGRASVAAVRAQSPATGRAKNLILCWLFAYGIVFAGTLQSNVKKVRALSAMGFSPP